MEKPQEHCTYTVHTVYIYSTYSIYTHAVSIVSACVGCLCSNWPCCLLTAVTWVRCFLLSLCWTCLGWCRVANWRRSRRRCPRCPSTAGPSPASPGQHQPAGSANAPCGTGSAGWGSKCNVVSCCCCCWWWGCWCFFTVNLLLSVLSDSEETAFTCVGVLLLKMLWMRPVRSHQVTDWMCWGFSKKKKVKLYSL